MLAAVEASGTERFFYGVDSRTNAAVRAINDVLHIEAGTRVKLKIPGIHVTLPATGGVVSFETILSIMNAELRKPDNVRKLSVSGASHSHLFIELGDRHYLANKALQYFELPPGLQFPVSAATHIWLAGHIPGLSSTRVICVSRVDGWRDLGWVAAGGTQ